MLDELTHKLSKVVADAPVGAKTLAALRRNMARVLAFRAPE